ncbi:hypothetical protein DL768_008941 [Monosporascus sp. mg162]|nr:hypothetical protein DL768_008941 [Monosporascus sp. mg162]
MRGNIDIVRRLIEAGSFISAEVYLSRGHCICLGSDNLEKILSAQPFGNCLSLAILRGHKDLALWLIQNTSLGHECGSAVIGPLHATAFAKSKSIAEALLKDGCDPNYQRTVDYSVSPLHVAAAIRNNAEIIQLLIDQGASVDICDKFSDTPLHYAIRFGNITNCDTLLSAGSDPTAKDLMGENVLDYASRQDSTLSVTKRIVSSFETNDVFSALIKAYKRTWGTSETFRTLISELQERCAREKKDMRTLRQGIQLESPQSQLSERDRTLFWKRTSKYHRVFLSNRTFNLAAFGCLLDSGWVDIEERDEYNHTFLRSAVAMNNSRAARALLLRGADREGVFPDSHREQLRQWELERKMTGHIWLPEEANKDALN